MGASARPQADRDARYAVRMAQNGSDGRAGAGDGHSADRLTALALKALLANRFERAEWEAIAGEQLHVRIGNAEPEIGRTRALDALAAFRARVLGFGCRYCDLWQRREAIYAETDVRYLDAGGMPRQIPCAIVARVSRGRLLDIRFHLDPSPIP
jgi:hypothetical protein